MSTDVGIKTISEIVGACQELEPVSEHDLRLAVLAIYYRLQNVCYAEPKSLATGLCEMPQERYDAWRKFMNATPAKWLGDGWTPGTEENMTRRRVAKAIFEKATVEKP